jgi:flagellar biosynthesis/type III secretory pathway protein FliH
MLIGPMLLLTGCGGVPETEKNPLVYSTSAQDPLKSLISVFKFPDVIVLNSLSQEVVLYNRGQKVIHFDTLNETNLGLTKPFTLSHNATQLAANCLDRPSLAAGESCALRIDFAPEMAQNYALTMNQSFTYDNNSKTPNKTSLALRGVGKIDCNAFPFLAEHKKQGAAEATDRMAKEYQTGREKGIALTNADGQKDGYQDNYQTAYDAAYKGPNGYPKGYNNGFIAGTNDALLVKNGFCGSGTSDGQVNGRTDGIHKGKNDGYNDGFAIGKSLAYTPAYNQGYAGGYKIGKGDGYSDGLSTSEERQYKDGYTAGRSTGAEVGYNQGYADGSYCPLKKPVKNPNPRLQLSSTDQKEGNLTDVENETAMTCFQYGYNETYIAGSENKGLQEEKAKNKAYQSGYTSGGNNAKSVGATNGIAQGLIDGYTVGHSDGFKKVGSDEYSRCYQTAYQISYTTEYNNAYAYSKSTGQSDGYLAFYSTYQAVGYNQGYSDGYFDGYAVGNSTYDDSYYYSGYNTGYSDGYNSYYDNGYNDGYATCR